MARLKILVVDRNPVSRAMIMSALPAEQFAVATAGTDESEDKLVERLRPEVLLLGTAGRDSERLAGVVRAVRAIEFGRTIGIVLLDGRYRDAAVAAREVHLTGASGALGLPALRDTIVRTVTDATQPASAANRAPPAPAATPAARTPSRRPSAAPSEAETAAKLRRFADRIDAVTYYELLEVAPATTAMEIKAAYFRAALEFHPDRMARLPDPALRERAYLVFKRVAEAFQVLVDPDRRARYDAQLSATASLGAVTPPPRVNYVERSAERGRDPSLFARTAEGRKHLRLALVAQKEGNLQVAMLELGFACDTEPDNRDLSRLLGELQAAIAKK